MKALVWLMVLSSIIPCVFLQRLGPIPGPATSPENVEKSLLDKLFSSYDRKVRPVLNESQTVKVAFGVQLRKIMRLDSKSQEITVGVTVTQIWSDPNLAWNKRIDFGSIETISVDPNEIWTPDIGLTNNADESVSVAGGKSKFQTNIVIHKNGRCVWRSPATFTSNCEINVKYWPFDVQSCELSFGSYTMPDNKISLTLLTQESNKAGKFQTSGDWHIRNISIERKIELYIQQNFTTSSLFIELERKPMYYVLNLVIPSVVLCFLSLLSFAIPSESGERIGFITTLLLAMTVYLLLIAEVLPETSNQLPLTALLFVLTIVESGAILVLTIVILRCFHAKGEPYGWLKILYLRCSCCRRPTKKISPASSPRVASAQDVEMKSVDEDDKLNVPPVDSNTDLNDPSWEDIAEFVNNIFFIFSFFMISGSYIGLLIFASN